MYETMRFLRLFAGFVGVGLTAAALTVTTAYAESGGEQAFVLRPAVAEVGIFDYFRQGILRRGRSDVHSIHLTAGTTYHFVATCDLDCDDVDLRLRRAGTVVAEDTLSDDVPVIRFTPRWSGTYTIEVLMYSCTRQPCGYELEVTAW